MLSNIAHVLSGLMLAEISPQKCAPQSQLFPPAQAASAASAGKGEARSSIFYSSSLDNQDEAKRTPSEPAGLYFSHPADREQRLERSPQLIIYACECFLCFSLPSAATSLPRLSIQSNTRALLISLMTLCINTRCYRK